MPKRRDRKGESLPPFVPMTWQLLNSDAYKALSYASRAMLPYFIGKPEYSDGKKINLRSDLYFKTKFTFSYREAVKLGCTTRTFTRVIEDLMRKGFIDPIDKGGLRGGGLSYNVFKMSDRWKQYNKKEFVEAIEWKKFIANTQK